MKHDHDMFGLKATFNSLDQPSQVYCLLQGTCDYDLVLLDAELQDGGAVEPVQQATSLHSLYGHFTPHDTMGCSSTSGSTLPLCTLPQPPC